MKKRFNVRSLSVLAIVLFAIILIGACAAKKPFWGDAETGYILKYNLPKGESLTYEAATEQLSAQEVMGQSMESTTTINSNYSIVGTGVDDQKNITSNVKMNSGGLKSVSPRGEQEFKLEALLNKEFGYTFAVNGKKIKFSNPEGIEVEMGGGKRDAESFFRNIFPTLPNSPIKIGGTWKDTEVDTVHEGGLDIIVEVETVNTLVGMESVNEMECFKITSVINATLEGTGQQGGADIYFEGDSDGKNTWYFAYKEGTFIKAKTEMTMEGTATVSGPQNMTIPITQNTTVEVKLVK